MFANLMANSSKLDSIENNHQVNEYIKEKINAEIEREMQSPNKTTMSNQMNRSTTKLQSFKRLDLKLVDTIGNLNNANFNIEIDR